MVKITPPFHLAHTLPLEGSYSNYPTISTQTGVVVMYEGHLKFNGPFSDLTLEGEGEEGLEEEAGCGVPRESADVQSLRSVMKGLVRIQSPSQTLSFIHRPLLCFARPQ